MTPTKPLALLATAVLLFSAGAASAQLSVQLKLNNTDYVAHEAVKATVTVHNRSGTDIVLPKGWLTFEITKDGRMISGHRGGSSAGATAFVLATGKNVTKTVDIGSLYPCYDWGNYRVTASVLFPPLNSYFDSAAQRFSVTDPKPFWSRSVGVPQGRGQLASFRKFSLIEHHGLKATEIYVRLEDTRGGRVYATYSLGRYINIAKPQATLDAQQRLHVMHMVGRQVHQHAIISPEGSFLGAELHKDAGPSRPKLMIDPSGVVKVKGGRPYKIEAERAARAAAERRRLATERPDGLPR